MYVELRKVARGYLRRERGGHTLQSAALVNEAYLRLINQRAVDWKNRAQFFGLAAQTMRRILVDHARKKQAEKRGGGGIRLSMSRELPAKERDEDVELLALHEALSRLAALDRRQSQVIELRYFGGLSVRETAEVLGVSTGTVDREWSLGKAWLRREIRGR